MKVATSHILVTGANRGIGKSLVEVALEFGAARVYATARDEESLHGLQSRFGDRLVPLVIDLTKPDSIVKAATRVEKLDLLINNAGVLSSAGLVSGRIEEIERDMQTNYFGTLAVTRAFLPAIERSRGSIANLLSVVALASMPGLGAYSASKAAALSLTQALRGELIKRGVHVHAVFPGPVDTDMAREITLPKTAPDVVARAIYAAIGRGEEDIFPDAMAQQVGGQWLKAPKEIERMFGAM